MFSSWAVYVLKLLHIWVRSPLQILRSNELLRQQLYLRRRCIPNCSYAFTTYLSETRSSHTCRGYSKSYNEVAAK